MDHHLNTMGNAHHQAIQASSQWVVRVLQSTHIVRIAIREPEDLEGYISGYESRNVRIIIPYCSQEDFYFSRFPNLILDTVLCIFFE